MLADRFGNRNQIVGQREALLRQAAAKPLGTECSAATLQEKHIAVSNHWKGLIEQGIQPATFDSHTAAEILRSLPYSVTERWRYAWGVHHAPTLDQVLHQLVTLIQVKAMEEAARCTDHITSTQTNAATVTTVRFRDKTPPRLICVICKSETHDSLSCTKGNPTERRKAVSEADRCFRCLGLGHRYYDCKEYLTCRNCQSTSHATALCPHDKRGRSPVRGPVPAHRRWSRSPSAERPSKPDMRASRSPSRSRSPAPHRPLNEQANVAGQVTAGVLLNFGAKAKVEKTGEGPNEWVSVRGIFDNGSGNSFITTDHARRLNARITGKEYIRVRTFGSDQPIEGYLDMPESLSQVLHTL